MLRRSFVGSLFAASAIPGVAQAEPLTGTPRPPLVRLGGKTKGVWFVNPDHVSLIHQTEGGSELTVGGQTISVANTPDEVFDGIFGAR